MSKRGRPQKIRNPQKVCIKMPGKYLTVIDGWCKEMSEKTGADFNRNTFVRNAVAAQIEKYGLDESII